MGECQVLHSETEWQWQSQCLVDGGVVPHLAVVDNGLPVLVHNVVWGEAVLAGLFDDGGLQTSRQ